MPESAPAPASADQLRALLASRPAVVLFAASPRDPAYETQTALLEGEADALASRDIALVQAVGEGDSYLERRRLAPEAAADLRARFDVDPGAFCIVLTGPGGVERHRDDTPLQPEAIYRRLSG